jgi:hypothetical protein
LLHATRFHVYRTTHLPPLGGGWSPWDDVLGDAAFVHLESGGAAPAVFAAAKELAMIRLLDVREWDGAGSHHVAVVPINGSFTLVFAVLTPDGPVFVVSPVPLSSLRRDVVKRETMAS